MQTLFGTVQMKILAGLVMLMVIIALASYAQFNFARVQHLDDTPPVITVSGEGEAFEVPTTAEFTFAVNVEADDATTAQEQSGTQINEIIAYLTERGIEERDIQTTSYNLYPRYRYEDRVCPAGSVCPPGERVQDGFTVNQTVSVKVRDTEDAGTLLAGVGERGATNISGLQFTVEDEEALQEEARAAAITDAQNKAVVLAEQLGVRIVRLANYSEGGGASPRMFAESASLAEDGRGGGFEGPDVPTGEQRVQANVTLQYEVR